MKRNRQYFDKLADLAQLPGELQPGKMLVELFGSSRVLIENHRGLICYSRNNIIVRSRSGSVTVSGDNMTIACMTAFQIVICGSIFGVSVKENERDQQHGR